MSNQPGRVISYVVCLQLPLLFCLIACVSFFSSCGYKKMVHVDMEGVRIPLFIAMPKNTDVFDNIGPLLYEALYRRFSLVGYRMVGVPRDGYQLCVSIQSWAPVQKVISPDVVLLHEQRALEILYKVCDFAGTVVFEKQGKFTVLLSKPENPILNTDFMNFELERLFIRVARDIELSIRPFFIKRFAHDVI